MSEWSSEILSKEKRRRNKRERERERVCVRERNEEKLYFSIFSTKINLSI